MSASVCCNLLIGLKHIRKPCLTQICSWKRKNLEESPENVSGPQGSVDRTLRTADLVYFLRFRLSSFLRVAEDTHVKLAFLFKSLEDLMLLDNLDNLGNLKQKIG